MKNTLKTFAITLILALSIGTAVQASGPGTTLSGPPKKIEKAAEHVKSGSEFMMEMESWMRGDLDVQVFDIDGNLVQSAKTKVEGQDNTLKFKAGELEKGIYKIKVLTKSRVQKKKIIVD